MHAGWMALRTLSSDQSVKNAKLKKSNKKLKGGDKSARVIATATVSTPIHPEVMGQVVLEN